MRKTMENIQKEKRHKRKSFIKQTQGRSIYAEIYKIIFEI